MAEARFVKQFAIWISALAVMAVFGACSAVLALMGVGVPFLLAALGLSVLAGGALYATLQAWVARQREMQGSPDQEPSAPGGDQALLAEVEAATTTLRHDLRGVLSPALLMADRLAGNPDPAVQRAGEVIVRSIDRATALIARKEPVD